MVNWPHFNDKNATIDVNEFYFTREVQLRCFWPFILLWKANQTS